MLTVLTRKLREAHDEVARLSMVPRTAVPSSEVATADPLDQRDQVPWEDVEEDLRD
jgi:hypothetical protein